MKKLEEYYITGINENNKPFSYFDNDQYIVDQIIDKIEEGLNITDDKIVEITDDHEDGGDTSINTNPIKRKFTVSDDLTIDLYSIFTRNDKLENDGNPLLYALKNEKQFKFKSLKALNFFWKRFDEVLEKFVNQYGYKDSVVIYNNDPLLLNTGIILPSSNLLNKEIARRVKEKFNNKLLIIDDILMKVPNEEIYYACKDPESYFSKHWKSIGENVYTAKLLLLSQYIKKMGGMQSLFSFHSIHDTELRKSIKNTMKLNKKYKDVYNQNINDKNILFIDDSITFGQSLKDAINVIINTYQPKSVTALTMLSQKQY